ncbi:MAG: hypothetical protein Salg2KO_21560 [Salibacteraceae bacterium]
MRTWMIIAIFTTHAALGQVPVNNNWWSAANVGGAVSASAGINVTSSKFTNQFARGLLLSEHLDNGSKKSQYGNLNAQGLNRVGMDYEVSLAGSHRIGQSPHQVVWKVSDAAHLDAAVDRDLYGLAFYGNQRYAGDTISIGGSEAFGMRYQKIGLGWNYIISEHTRTHVMLNYVNGEQLVEVQFERARLYTSNLGDTLDVDVLGTYRQSDSGQVGFASPNGAGLSIDLGFVTTFQAKSSEWVFQAAVYDLGMVQWGGRTIEVSADTIVNWTGVALPDLEGVDSEFTTQLEDSVNHLVDGVSKNQTHNTWLAGTAAISLMQSKSKGIEFGGGAAVRWQANYAPFSYLVGGYQFSQAIGASMQVGYGGYGTIQAGINFDARFEHFLVELQLANLEAWAVPSRFGGASGRLNLQYVF